MPFFWLGLAALGLQALKFGHDVGTQAARNKREQAYANQQRRLQIAEHDANIEILSAVLDPTITLDDGRRISKLEQSFMFEREKFEFEGMMAHSQMGAQRQEAADVVSDVNVRAAMLGLSGGSMGFMGERVKSEYDQRTEEMMKMFGEEMELDLTKGIYGDQYTTLLFEQEQELLEKTKEREVLEGAVKELDPTRGVDFSNIKIPSINIGKVI